MDTLPKWRRTIDYYAYKAIRLERELGDMTFDRGRLQAAVNKLSEKKPKKFSQSFVVFRQDADGKYNSPVIVEADCPEEALCPEGCEEPRGDFCHRLYDASEYDEI